MSKKIFLYSNPNKDSVDLKASLGEKLTNSGFVVTPELTKDTDLIICVGGDGTFLRLIHDMDFPDTPIMGINTGHLGFFQELTVENMESVLNRYLHDEEHEIRLLSTLRCEVTLKGGETEVLYGLNEIVVRGDPAKNTHLLISIGDSFIERFSGDGILVASPAGSTAYNYALGGSIVDPNLELLQLTPMAPSNNRTYRSFTSSLILPSYQTLEVIPDPGMDPYLTVIIDGFTSNYSDVEKIQMGYSEHKLRMVQFSDYGFWKKVKEKFL